MNDYMLLEEAACVPGVPTANALRASIRRGEIQAFKVPKGSRMVWALSNFVIEQLKSKANGNSEYETCLEQWKDEQRRGYQREAPLEETTIEKNGHGMNAFWDFLDGVRPCHQNEVKERRSLYAKPKTLDRFTLENISLAISKVPKDKQGSKESIYKASMSFYQSLAYKGLRSEYDLVKFKKFKPRQNRRPKRTFLKDDETFNALLEENRAWYKGRSKGDIRLSEIILKTLYYTGMRNSEVCKLMLKDVSLKDQVIFIERAKMDKDREVGIDPELLEALEEYLEFDRPTSTHKNFFLQVNGEPLNRKIVLKRIKNLAARLDEELTPHGLRRTFITNLLQEGAPTVLVKKIVGHGHISTTEKYDMTSSRDALDLIRKPQRQLPSKTEKPKKRTEF